VTLQRQANKVAMITGFDSGVGQARAAPLVAEGADLVITPLSTGNGGTHG